MEHGDYYCFVLLVFVFFIGSTPSVESNAGPEPTTLRSRPQLK